MAEIIPIAGLAILFTVVAATTASANMAASEPTGTCGTSKKCATGPGTGWSVCAQFLSYPTGTANSGLNDWAEYDVECGMEFDPFPFPTGSYCGGATYAPNPICP